MAILPSCPGLTVEVIVEEKALPEYDYSDKTVSGYEVTKYVEAQAGKEFGIRYEFDNNFSTTKDVQVQLWIDGQYASGGVHDKHKLNSGWHIRNVTQRVNGNWVERAMRFNDIDIVHDFDSALDHGSFGAHKSLGEFKILCEFGKVGRKSLGRKGVQFEGEKHGKVHESKIKGDAKSLHTILGAAKSIKAPMHWKWTASKKSPKHFAVFCFKYRSKENLQALCILPRDNSPSPIEEARTSISLPRLSTGLSSSPSNTHIGLGTADMIALIKHHRGHDQGLQGLSEEELSVLLGMYQSRSQVNPKIQGTLIKKESVGPRIKREADADTNDNRREDKRSKKEIIVLDD